MAIEFAFSSSNMRRLAGEGLHSKQIDPRSRDQTLRGK